MSFKTTDVCKLIFLLGILLFTVLEHSEGLIEEVNNEAPNSTISSNPDTKPAIRIPAIKTESEEVEASPFIAGGSPATLGQFPYSVSLRHSRTGQHFCGGSIISNNWILTAAQCFDRIVPSGITVVVGTIHLNSGGTRYGVNQIIPHEGYIDPLSGNDIGLLEIDGTIEFTASVNKIGLGTQPPLTSINVVASGFGEKDTSGIYSEVLQHVQLTTIPYLQCRNNFPPGTPPAPLGSVCTSTQAGQGICHGDQGGPLVDIATGLQIGVGSYHAQCAIGYPDVYSCVPFYRRWILEKTGGLL